MLEAMRAYAKKVETEYGLPEAAPHFTDRFISEVNGEKVVFKSACWGVGPAEMVWIWRLEDE